VSVPPFGRPTPSGSAGPERADRDDREPDQPIVRDKRRVRFDPATGATSEPAAAAGSGAAHRGAGAEPLSDIDSIELGQLRTDMAERTADLQRLQAEYANYRKRVERDREAVREIAVGDALAGLLPVLDDIGRARAHDELQGGFKGVAEALEAAMAKLGLTVYGEPGDPFDPNLHEALMHSYSADVAVPTAVEILQPGYSYAGRVLRAARVAVAEPEMAAEPEKQADAE
jgi:molecular chaperone GrpE